jgi:hypothetical protein
VCGRYQDSIYVGLVIALHRESRRINLQLVLFAVGGECLDLLAVVVELDLLPGLVTCGLERGLDFGSLLGRGLTISVGGYHAHYCDPDALGCRSIES